MFDDIGSKLKTLAKVSTILGIIGSVIAGCALMGDDFLTGLLILVLGSVFSWIGSFTVYGLGQLIENTDELVKQGQVQVQQGRVQIQQNISTPAPAAKETPAPAPSSPLDAFLAQSSVPDDRIDLGAGFFRCPNCKTVQNKRDTCRYCNKPLMPTQASPFINEQHQTGQAPAAGIPAGTGKISCPICGTVQNADRRVCFECAQPLIPTEL